jgi:hypothetical protein
VYCTRPFDVVPIVATLIFKLAVFTFLSKPKAGRPPLIGCSRLFIQHIPKKFGLVSGCDHSNEFPAFTEGKEFRLVMNNYQLLDISSMRLIEAFTEISEFDLTFGALICTLVLS